MSYTKITCIFLLFIFIAFESCAQKAISKKDLQPYEWKNVQIAGGGFVDGIIFHPKAKDIRYCRTDMGGAYCWEDRKNCWEPLIDFLSYEDRNLMGVESIAVDPHDTNFVILACGTYTNPRAGNGAIFRSFNQGKTFQRIDVPFKFGGNENGRGNGERMMVDPKNGNIIYLGTRLNGLWKSIDKGITWNEVKSFVSAIENIPPTLGPDSIQKRKAQFQSRGSGVVMVVYDTANKRKNYSTVYAFVSLMGSNNLFKSEDDGNTWSAVPNQPTQNRPTHSILAPDGMLYITYGNNPGPAPMTSGAVWKFSTLTGDWTDITPDPPSAQRQFGYAAVAVDPQNSQTVIVSTFNRYNAGGEEIFRSLDGGRSWKPILKQSEFDYSLAP